MRADPLHPSEGLRVWVDRGKKGRGVRRREVRKWKVEKEKRKKKGKNAFLIVYVSTWPARCYRLHLYLTHSADWLNLLHENQLKQRLQQVAKISSKYAAHIKGAILSPVKSGGKEAKGGGVGFRG